MGLCVVEWILSWGGYKYLLCIVGWNDYDRIWRMMRGWDAKRTVYDRVVGWWVHWLHSSNGGGILSGHSLTIYHTIRILLGGGVYFWY